MMLQLAVEPMLMSGRIMRMDPPSGYTCLGHVLFGDMAPHPIQINTDMLLLVKAMHACMCMQNTIHSMSVVLMNMNSDWLSATLQH